MVSVTFCPCTIALLIRWPVFDLPNDLLVTLRQKDLTLLQDPVDPSRERDGLSSNPEKEAADGEAMGSTSCQLCAASFDNVQEQRLHVKSDWHNYNIKRKIRGAQSATEVEFEKLVEELEESISGSGSEGSESEADGEGAKESTLSTLLKKQAKLSHPEAEEEGGFVPKRKQRNSGTPPLVWFTTPLLPQNTSLGVYRAILTNAEEEESNMVEVIRKKQIHPTPTRTLPNDDSNGVALPSTVTSPSVFMCMIGGGHFAGMIVSLAPKLAKQSTGTEQRQAIVIAHKTFHRYTTRRKQGGSQSANDAAKGAAHSAGSSLRRYNEVALGQEIRALLSEWRDLIGNVELVFVRATGSSNRRILYGPYDGQVLRHNDPRNRTLPFSTRRATQAELMRAFVELTRVKVSRVDQAGLAAAAVQSENAQLTKTLIAPQEHQPNKEEQEAILNTSQLQSLIRRSKAPAIVSYLSSHSLSPNYLFHPPSAQVHHHAPMPLHLASSVNSSAVVLALLTKAGADPTLVNGEGKPAFDLTGNRATRDAFRVARSELGENKWDWSAAHVPPPLSKAEAEERGAREKADADRAETKRRKAEEERLRKEKPAIDQDTNKGGKTLGVVPRTAEERREEDARGMTPEIRIRIERERRARAAEERMKRTAGAS